MHSKYWVIICVAALFFAIIYLYVTTNKCNEGFNLKSNNNVKLNLSPDEKMLLNLSDADIAKINSYNLSEKQIDFFNKKTMNSFNAEYGRISSKMNDNLSTIVKNNDAAVKNNTVCQNELNLITGSNNTCKSNYAVKMAEYNDYSKINAIQKNLLNVT
jgi:preprotein translocase subunit SecF